MRRLLLHATMLMVWVTIGNGCARTTIQPVATLPALPAEKIEFKQVQFGDAREYAKLLRELFGLTVTCDSRTQTIVLKGPPDTVSVAIVTIDKLETAGLDDYPPHVFFMKRLKHADARIAATLLEDMKNKGVFVQEPRDNHPPVAVFYYAAENAVWVYTTRMNEDRVHNILDEIDRPATTLPQPEIRINRSPLSPDDR